MLPFPHRWIRQRSLQLASLALITAGLALVLALLIPQDGFLASDQGAKLVQVESLLHHRFADLSLVYSGENIDPAGALSPLPALYAVRHRGRWVSIYSYPYALLGAMAHALAGPIGLRGLSLLAVVGMLWIAASLARTLGLRSAEAVPWLLILATPLLFYALVFWEHALAGLMALGGLALSDRSVRNHSSGTALLAGLVAAAGFGIRTELLFFGPALCLGLAIALPTARRLARAQILGWSLGVLPLLLWNLRIYGHLLGGGVIKNYSDRPWLERLVADRDQIIEGLIFDRGLSPWLLALVIVAVLAMRWATARWVAVGIFILATASLGLRYDEPGMFIETGLAASCPLLLLAFARRPGGDSASPSRSLLLWTSGAYIVMVTLTAPNDGGTQWGPRYLIAVVVPLTLLAVSHVEGWWRSREPTTWRWIAASLLIVFLVSVSQQIHSVGFLRSLLYHRQAIHQATVEVGHEIVLTDVWWGPSLLAPLYFDRSVMLLHRQTQLSQFVEMLRAHEIDRFVFAATQTWSKDPATRTAAGIACHLVRDFSAAVVVLDCQLPDAGTGPGG